MCNGGPGDVPLNTTDRRVSQFRLMSSSVANRTYSGSKSSSPGSGRPAAEADHIETAKTAQDRTAAMGVFMVAAGVLGC